MGKADYFVRRGNEERGPTTAARIRELAAAGKLSKDDAIRRGDNGDWYRAGDIPGLFDGAAGADDGELIDDPLVNLSKRAASTISKAAGQMGSAVKGIMARHAEKTASPPEAQVPAKQPARPVTIVQVESPALIDMRGAEALDTCPFCNETITRGARKCKHCGEFLDTGLTTSARHPQANLPAQVPPQTPHVVVIQTHAPPVQPPTNIIFAPVISNDNRSGARATAKSRQKATAAATSFWSRPLSGCGCLTTLLVALVGVLLFLVLRAIIPSFGKSRTEQNISAPAEREKAMGNLAPALVAQQKTDRSPTNEKPATQDGDPAVDLAREDPLEATKKAEVAQRQREAAEKAEHDATAKLKLAKSLMSANKKSASERLKEIVEKYPGTEAAEDAKELLAGRDPKPRVPKAEKRLDSHSSIENSARRQFQAAKSTPRATVVRSRLVDFVSPGNGRKMQMLIVTLKNTGSTPIRAVSADITYRDSSGKIVTTENGCVFAEFNSSPGIAPGRTWTTPKGEGRLLPGLGLDPKSKTAEVRITEVLEDAGME